MQQRTIELGDVRVNYAEAGSGPPIVIVHAGGSHSAWQVWEENVTALSSQFRILVPDLPGLGDSGPPPVPIDSEDDFFRYFPRFLNMFLRALTPEGAVLIGAASAGGVCLTVAARYPDIVQALILVDAEVIGRVIETETSMLRCPTLIVWQQDDRLTPADHAHTLASRIPGAEVRLFPGDSTRDEWGGTMPHRLWPTEFDATVLDFVARVTS